MTYKTLGDLRGTLARRLGFGAQGSAGVNSGLLDSFLQDAQAQLWSQFEWRHLIKYDEKATESGSTLYDWATDCDPKRPLYDVAVWDGNVWIPLREGINWAMRSTASVPTIPARYERFAQMEIWPAPDAAYTVRRYYVATCARFSQDNDRASVDDDLIFLHALTNAKRHYRQPDAEQYGSQLESMLLRLKSQSRGESVIRRGGDPAPIPRPRIV